MICTDASDTGGGACESAGLTPHWHEYWTNVHADLQRSPTVLSYAPTQVFPTQVPCHPAMRPRVFLISLFDGVGGASQALRLCDVQPAVHVVIELLSEARRCTRSHHRVWREYDDITAVTSRDVRSWHMAHADAIDTVLLVAGFPCVDLSSLKAGRQGIDGPSSGLIHEAIRIHKEVVAFFGADKVIRLFENVESMPEGERLRINALLDLEPMLIDAAPVSHCRRPRLYWTDSAPISGRDATVTQKVGVKHVLLRTKRLPPISTFLEPNCAVTKDFVKFPTFTRPRPRTYPGRKPAGLERCSDEAAQRWSANLHRYQPYQYENRFLVVTPDSARPPTANERERMLGFTTNYTSALLSKKATREEKADLEDMRCNALGNSFSVIVVARIMSQVLNLDLTVDCLWKNWAFLEGVATTSDKDAIERAPKNKNRGVPGPWTPDALVVYTFMRMADPRGSDIRLNPGTLFENRAWPRQSIPMGFWKWSTIQSYEFHIPEHINLLEQRAHFNYLRRRATQPDRYRSRFLEIFDNQVITAVNTKGRSSSIRLNRLQRRCAAICLVAALYPFHGWCKSDANPADLPSRRSKKRRLSPDAENHSR